MEECDRDEILIFTEDVNHSFMLNEYDFFSDFTIESIELKEGYRENEGKVFITRSDGKSGYMCGFMNSQAADVICRAAGFALVFYTCVQSGLLWCFIWLRPPARHLCRFKHS